MALHVFLLALSLGSAIEAFKILVFYPTPSFSHQRSIMALTEKLVQEGHEVFVVSPNIVPGLENKNYTFVDVSFSYAKFISDEKKEGALHLQGQMSKWETLSRFEPLLTIIKDQFLSEPFLQFQRRVETEQIKFDVVVMETLYLPFTCAMSRLLTGNAPIISMTTLSFDFYVDDNIGNIRHLSHVPSFFGSYTDRMSLWQKVENWFSDHYIRHYLSKQQDESARQFFKETYGAESLVDGCWTNASLSFVSSDFLYFYPRLLAPNAIELGPMHIKPPDKLPKNLQDWLDGAEKGVIYFSLGSNMKSKSLPEDVRSNFLKIFRELPPGYRVLWKWELDGKIPGQSDNILGQKWLPQESILAHPKVKVFITQGGLQSFQEAVHYGVPIIGIPWFGDQECNVAKIVDTIVGVRLGPEELYSYQKIKESLEKVLYDDRYSRNMKRLSAISRDFTSQSLDKAIFWVEHVARHGGASHLRPSTADTTYFQFFCLDIISVILALSFIVLYIIYSICKYLIFKAFKNMNSKIKKS